MSDWVSAKVAMTVPCSVTSGEELQWKEVAELPRSVAGYMAGVTSGKLLIIGGSYWKNKQKCWSDLVQAFDPLTNTWQNETPLPAPRSDAASTSLNDKIYIFGGGAGTEARRDALVLRDRKWNALPAASLPEPRLYATAISACGYIYLLGGMPRACDYRRVTNTFWRWYPNSTGWEVLPPLPGPGRISHAMAEIDGNIYVFGGATTGPKDVENLRDVYKYSPADNKWTRMPDLSVANRTWWAVGLDDRALLLAGYTNCFARTVYIYDPLHNLQSVNQLPRGLADIKFFRIRDIVVGAGGEAGPEIRSNWTLQMKLPKTWLSKKPKRLLSTLVEPSHHEA